MLILRAARAGELDALTDLCLRSKAVWGYDRAFMDACRNELTLTQEDLRTTKLQVAERDGGVIGVAQVSAEGATAHLEKLFVEPGQLRGGAGRRLFEWAKAAAADFGATHLVDRGRPRRRTLLPPHGRARRRCRTVRFDTRPRSAASQAEPRLRSGRVAWECTQLYRPAAHTPPIAPTNLLESERAMMGAKPSADPRHLLCPNRWPHRQQALRGRRPMRCDLTFSTRNSWL